MSPTHRYGYVVVYEPSFGDSTSVRMEVVVEYRDGVEGLGVYWVPAYLGRGMHFRREGKALRIASAVARGIATQVELEESQGTRSG